MTSNVKSGQPIVEVCMLFFPLRASAEPEPGIRDGGSCCAPWLGSHLPCLRRVPASVAARVSSYEPQNAAEGYPTPGLRLYRGPWEPVEVAGPGVNGPSRLRLRLDAVW